MFVLLASIRHPVGSERTTAMQPNAPALLHSAHAPRPRPPRSAAGQPRSGHHQPMTPPQHSTPAGLAPKLSALLAGAVSAAVGVVLAFFLSGWVVDSWYRSSNSIPPQEDLFNDYGLGMVLLATTLLSLMIFGPICFFAGWRWMRRRLARSG